MHTDHTDSEQLNYPFDPGPPPRLTLTGELDLRVSAHLQQALMEAEPASGDLLIDLEAVTYLDSSVWSALIEASVRLSRTNRRLVLVKPQRPIQHTLSLAGFNRYFAVQDAAGSSDDAVHPPPQTALAWQHAAFSIPCRVSLLGMARERVMSVARSMSFSVEELGEIELAVGEALSNALRHGSDNPEKQITIECEASGPALTLRVTDPGQGFLPEMVPVPVMDAFQEGGMGLHFMRLMMDVVEYQFNEQGTTVCLTKRPKQD